MAHAGTTGTIWNTRTVGFSTMEPTCAPSRPKAQDGISENQATGRGATGDRAHAYSTYVRSRSPSRHPRAPLRHIFE